MTRDLRLQVDWLARGKAWIAISAEGTPIAEFVAAGANLSAITPKEGTYLSVDGGTMSLMSKAPHPYAARVFINWLLSREGQMVHSRAYGKPSLRVDVSDDFIDPAERPQPGMSYFEQEEKFYVEDKPRFMQIARDLFKPLSQ